MNGEGQYAVAAKEWTRFLDRCWERGEAPSDEEWQRHLRNTALEHLRHAHNLLSHAADPEESLEGGSQAADEIIAFVKASPFRYPPFPSRFPTRRGTCTSLETTARLPERCRRAETNWERCHMPTISPPPSGPNSGVERSGVLRAGARRAAEPSGYTSIIEPTDLAARRRSMISSCSATTAIWPFTRTAGAIDRRGSCRNTRGSVSGTLRAQTA